MSRGFYHDAFDDAYYVIIYTPVYGHHRAISGVPFPLAAPVREPRSWNAASGSPSTLATKSPVKNERLELERTLFACPCG